MEASVEIDCLFEGLIKRFAEIPSQQIIDRKLSFSSCIKIGEETVDVLDGFLIELSFEIVDKDRVIYLSSVLGELVEDERDVFWCEEV